MRHIENEEVRCRGVECAVADLELALQSFSLCRLVFENCFELERRGATVHRLAGGVPRPGLCDSFPCLGELAVRGILLRDFHNAGDLSAPERVIPQQYVTFIYRHATAAAA